MAQPPDGERGGDSPIAYDATAPRGAGDDPPQAGLLPAGELLADRYRIVRFIARGGMGAVYEAEDQALGVRVALKTIRPEVAEQKSAAARFKREIQLARKVTHPNVCRIFDLGSHSPELLFLTMELLDGETLAERLRRDGPLRFDEALPLVRQMAAGLGAAHAAGVVHRDFKSRNVILAPSGSGTRVVITDFGLAHEPEAGESDLSTTRGLLGTPAYMAPEQVEGGRATAASDVYAFGVVLYEMATGRLPFVGETPLSVAVKRLKEPPPRPREIKRDVDPRWEGVILRCLEREPARRFGSAAEVSLALAEGRVARRAARGRWAAGILGAVALIAGGTIALRHRAPSASPAPVGEAHRDRGVRVTLPRDAASARDYQEARTASAGEDWSKARTLLEEAVRRAPAFAAGHAELAWVLGRFRDGGAAAEAARAEGLAAGLPPDERLLIEIVGRLVRGEAVQAIPGLRQLERRYPESIDYGRWLFGAQLAAGRVDEARATIARLRRLPEPLDQDPRIDLAELEVTPAFPAELVLVRAAEVKARADKTPLVLAAARAAESWTLWNLGRLDEAVAAATEAKDLFETGGWTRGVAESLNSLAVTRFLLGDLVGAEQAVTESLAAVPGDRLNQSVLHANRSLAVASQGRLAEAEKEVDEAISTALGIGNSLALALAQYSAGWVFQIAGELARARQSYDAAIPLLRKQRDLRLLAWCLAKSGELRIAEDNRSQARVELQESLDLRTRLAQPTMIAESQLGLARLLIDEGRPQEAAALARTAHVELEREHARDDEARALTVLARALLAGKNTEGARTAIDRALGRVGATDNPTVRAEIQLIAARVQMAGGEPQQDEARRTLTMVQAETERIGLRGVTLEARLALAELDLRGADRARARTRLVSLARDARQGGFLRLAKAATSAGRSRAAASDEGKLLTPAF